MKATETCRESKTRSRCTRGQKYDGILFGKLNGTKLGQTSIARGAEALLDTALVAMISMATIRAAVTPEPYIAAKTHCIGQSYS